MNRGGGIGDTVVVAPIRPAAVSLF